MTTIAPCQMTRELRMKLALAKLLNGEINVTRINFIWMRGPYSGQVVRDTEWDYVIRKVVMDEQFGHCDDWPSWTHEAEGVLLRRGIEW